MAKLNLINKNQSNMKMFQEDVVVKSMYGYNYEYRTDSENEEKYANKKFKKFYKLPKSEQKKRMLRLWRKAYITGLTCSVIIGQFHAIHTKMSYFGRHMIVQDNV